MRPFDFRGWEQAHRLQKWPLELGGQDPSVSSDLSKVAVFFPGQILPETFIYGRGIELLLGVKDVGVINVSMALVCRVVCVCGL